MRLDDFLEGLRADWAGDPQVADHPIDRKFQDIPKATGGMATENKLALLNLAARCLAPGEVYLEVGSYLGTSIIGAALDNDDKDFVTIDNFSLFGGPRDQCLENVRTHCPKGNVQVVEADAWEAIAADVTTGRPVGSLFYDGGHSFDEQWQAFERVEARFADQAVIIVDDTRRRSISAANRTYTLGRDDYTLLRRFRSPHNGDPRWWNGIEVYAYRRRAGSRPTPRSVRFHAVKGAFAAGHRAKVLRERAQATARAPAPASRVADERFPTGVRVRRRLARALDGRCSALLPDRHVPIPGRDGRIYLNLRESAMMVERALRVYEYWTATFMRAALGPGMTAIDVGANKGDYTLMFAHRVGPGGAVLSFEPSPDNCVWLRKSIDANRYRWVDVEPVALAAAEGTATFYPGLKSGWGSLRAGRFVAPDEDPYEVRTRPLDEVLAERGVVDVDLLKIDVEGAELGVLEGARDLLERCDTLTVVMDVDSHDADERRRVHDLLLGAGMRIWAVGKRLRPLDDLTGITTIVAAKRTPIAA